MSRYEGTQSLPDKSSALLTPSLENEKNRAGLKNDVDQVNDLLPYFDWALDEQCFQYKRDLLASLFSNKQGECMGTLSVLRAAATH
jgi:hypothetical protein